MIDRLKRLLPDAEAVRNNRWLRWLGPTLHDPRLWRPSRHSVALGVALGIFFGLLVPLAQIPLSVGMAVLLRANVPTAIASTLVSNPVTFGPIYYMAYQIGNTLLGEDGAHAPQNAPKPPDESTAATPEGTWERITSVGKPLLLGLAIMASAMGLLAYLVVTWLWQLKTWLSGRRTERTALPLADTKQKTDTGQ